MFNSGPLQSRLVGIAHSLALRLVGTVALAIGLALAVAAYAMWRQDELAAELDRLAEQGLQRVVLIWEANENANDAARKMLVLVTSPPEFHAGVHEEIAAANRRLDAALNLLRADLHDDASLPRLESVFDARQRYEDSFLAMANAVREGDLEGARQQLASITDFELSMLLSTLELLDRSQRHEVEVAMDALRARQQEDRAVFAVLLLVALGAGAALPLWVWLAAAKPLRAAATIAQSLANGDYSRRLGGARKDEIGDLIQALNRLAAEVDRRETQLRELAETDALTGLAERDRFLRLTSSVLNARSPDAAAAVVVVDLDRLSTINQLLGFEAGDAAVKAVAQHLRTVVGPDVHVGRIGGGRFAVALASSALPSSDQSLAEWIEQLQQRLEQRSVWREHVIDLHLTVGVAAAPREDRDAALLLKRAERALQDAKQRALAVAVWTQALEDARPAYLSLLSDLQRACEDGEIVAFLQPRIDVASGSVVGAEALARWRHPVRGWIPPSEFVPFAESAGRVGLITNEMLRQGIAAARQLLDVGHQIQIAVNLSAHDLRDVSLSTRVGERLSQAGLSPNQLQLELTESSLVDTGDEPVRRLRELRALGIDLAIDDFGTGQTAISQLHRWPMQTVKIDRQFVHGVDAYPSTRKALLEAIVQLAASMGMRTTAEGVETLGELEAIRQAGCDSAQGWLFAKAMPVDEFERWLKARDAGEASAWKTSRVT